MQSSGPQSQSQVCWNGRRCVNRCGLPKFHRRYRARSAGMDAAASIDVVYQNSTVATEPGLLEWTPLRQQMWFTKIPPSLQSQVCWNGRRCANRCGLPKFHRRYRARSAGMDAAASIDVVYQNSTVATEPGLLEWTPLRQQMWFTKIPPSLQSQVCWNGRRCVNRCGLPKFHRRYRARSAGMDAAAPTDVVYQDSTVATEPGLLEWTPLRQQMWFTKIPPSLQSQVCWNGRRCVNRCGLPRFHRRYRARSAGMDAAASTDVVYQDSTVATEPGLLEWTPLRQQMWFTKIPPSLQSQLVFAVPQLVLLSSFPAFAHACAPRLPTRCVTKRDTDRSAGMDAAASTDVVYQNSTVATEPGLLEWTPLRQQMWFTKIPPSLQSQVCWNGRRCVNRCGLPRFHRRYRARSTGMDAAASTDVVYQDSTVATEPGLLEWTPLRQQMWFTKIPPSLQSQVRLRGSAGMDAAAPTDVVYQNSTVATEPGLLEWTPLRQQMWFTKIPPSLQSQLVLLSKPSFPAFAHACAPRLPTRCVTKRDTDRSAGMDAAASTDVVYQDSTVATEPGLLEWTPLRQQMWFTKIPPSLQSQMWFTKIPPSLQSQMRHQARHRSETDESPPGSPFRRLPLELALALEELQGGTHGRGGGANSRLHTPAGASDGGRSGLLNDYEQLLALDEGRMRRAVRPEVIRGLPTRSQVPAPSSQAAQAQQAKTTKVQPRSAPARPQQPKAQPKTQQAATAKAQLAKAPAATGTHGQARTQRPQQPRQPAPQRPAVASSVEQPNSSSRPSYMRSTAASCAKALDRGAQQPPAAAAVELKGYKARRVR
ncbi:hypothetical protein PLESTB_001359300 [Pleodorina starrii]|uniref:Uncharacterized protein n=1 Tax=Pleodorina starrii TaxID=330485 RepID=A0A9W6F7A6_9CHLO|nr:hypothetical protein PLESTB_001359300 [Pleodorina starrii]